MKLKFPYGNADFYQLMTENYFYQDRTAHIPLLEEVGKNILLLRPRRFGKSLFLSMLANYYDLAKADQFDRLFGHLAIGQNPTPLRNQYFVLRWDFSLVNPRGDVDAIEQSMYHTINVAIEDFIVHYDGFLKHQINIHPTDGLISFQSLLASARASGRFVYLMVDEYDNFANEVMVNRARGQQRYDELMRGEGILKTLFKVLKGMLVGRGLDRIFMTGVSPVVMSDITSGQFVAENIFFEPEFNDVCGFTEPEVQGMLQQVADYCGLSETKTREAMDMMRRYYDGYQFVLPPDSGETMYNATMVLYFLGYLQKRCRYPRNLLDSNLSPDRNKITYVASIPGGGRVILKALEPADGLKVGHIEDRFGVEEMLYASENDNLATSLLYYLGMLTWTGRVDEFGEMIMRVPNMTIRGLYYERLQKILLPNTTTNQADWAAKAFYTYADLQPICDLVDERFKSFDNRDYRTADELVLKGMFLSMLFNNIIYLTDSERTLNRGYADMTMIVRPDMRQYQLLDHVIEFKFVTLSDAGHTGAELRAMSADAVAQLDAVQETLAQAKTQLPRYRQALHEIYGDGLRLHAHVVIGVGFERVVWVKVDT